MELARQSAKLRRKKVHQVRKVHHAPGGLMFYLWADSRRRSGYMAAAVSGWVGTNYRLLMLGDRVATTPEACKRGYDLHTVGQVVRILVPEMDKGVLASRVVLVDFGRCTGHAAFRVEELRVSSRSPREEYFVEP